MKSICADLVLQRLKPVNGVGLNRLLYDCLREAILDGTLLPLTALPASRDLAREINLSRNTVLHAYGQLQAEGYVHSRVGSGTYIAPTNPDSFLSSGRTLKANTDMLKPVRLSRRAQALLDTASASPLQWGAFMPGVPDVTQFPHRQFSRILSKLWRTPKPEMLTYAHGGGSLALRTAIAAHLRVARSVQCDADQILVTEGVHQALDMTLRMLVDPSETVWVEEPGYWGFHKVLLMGSASVQVMRADEGKVTWPSGRSTPRLVFVTPSHQYPLGYVMSLARRRELIKFARKSGSWIVEDDYDSEFRFAGHPIPAMQGLENDAPVIYIGTFSKTLFPGLRVGYMVLPKALAQPFRVAHADLYREGHTITQAALAEWMEQGQYASHIRRMRVIYAKRRAILVALVLQHLGPQFLDPLASNAGLHLVLRLRDDCDDVEIAREAQAKGVLTRPLSQYYLRDKARKGLLLGFACVEDSEIPIAFHKLVTCLGEAQKYSKKGSKRQEAKLSAHIKRAQ